MKNFKSKDLMISIKPSVLLSDSLNNQSPCLIPSNADGNHPEVFNLFCDGESNGDGCDGVSCDDSSCPEPSLGVPDCPAPSKNPQDQFKHLGYSLSAELMELKKSLAILKSGN